MTHREDARHIALRYPLEARAGWLLACDAPDNIAKGQRMFDRMDAADQARAIIYRDHCVFLYTEGRTP